MAAEARVDQQRYGQRQRHCSGTTSTRRRKVFRQASLKFVSANMRWKLSSVNPPLSAANERISACVNGMRMRTRGRPSMEYERESRSCPFAYASAVQRSRDRWRPVSVGDRLAREPVERDAAVHD